MGKENRGAWTTDCPGIGWGLQFTVQRRQRVPGDLQLRVIAPFVALGGRRPRAAAMPGGLAAALPWLTPRWLEGPQRNETPVRADEPVSRTAVVSVSAAGSPVAVPAAATVPAAALAAEPGPRQPQEQWPVAFALALQMGSTVPGKAGRQIMVGTGKKEVAGRAGIVTGSVIRSVTGGKTGPAPGAMAGAGLPQGRQPQSLPYHAGVAWPVDNLSATDVRIEPGPGGAGSETTAGSSEAERSLPPVFHRPQGAEPAPVPLSGSQRGVAPPRLPVSGLLHGVMPPGLPVPGLWHRPVSSELPVPGRLHGSMPPRFSPMPPAWKFSGAPGGLTPETTLSWEHQAMRGAGYIPGTLYGTAAPGPGPVPLQGLGLVMEVITRTVEREVAEAVKKRSKEIRKPAPESRDMPGMPAQDSPVSDSVVRLYMQKMRKLAEEERFRLGLLR